MTGKHMKKMGQTVQFVIKINGKPFGTKLLRLPQGRRTFWSGFWSLDFGFVFVFAFRNVMGKQWTGQKKNK